MTEQEDDKGGKDPEIVAIGAVYLALKGLEQDAQHRVLDYVSAKLDLPRMRRDTDSQRVVDARDNDPPEEETPEEEEGATAEDDVLEGVSPIAQKWLRRSGLSPNAVGTVFSLGIDEIDLVAPSVPGSGKKAKLRSVLLLRGIASYLASGTARFNYAQLKEAAVHYDAFDAPNFAASMKAFASEVSGTKKSGYTLTARGITQATALLKEMLANTDQ